MVAVQEDRMKRTSWRTYNARHKVIAQAQRLARSGQHTDHTTIIPQLAHMEGFEAARARFEERAIRAQLDKLCVMARNHGANPARRSA